LYYVRRSLLVNKAKLFEQFAAILDKYSVELPHQSWTSKHDRDLLKLVSLYGYDNDKIQSELQIPAKKAIARVEAICVLIKENQQSAKSIKKSKFASEMHMLQQQAEPTKISMSLFVKDAAKN
jgi:hypothetical protein